MKRLTDDQVLALARHLEGTDKNPLTSCDALFGHRPSVEIYERLAGLGEGAVSRCVECGLWRRVEEFERLESGDPAAYCRGCDPGDPAAPDGFIA